MFNFLKRFFTKKQDNLQKHLYNNQLEAINKNILSYREKLEEAYMERSMVEDALIRELY